MIIGKNNNNNNQISSNFEERFNFIKKEGKKAENKINAFKLGDNNKPKDMLNKNNMADQSISLLQEKLQRGTISLDDFNKKTEQINKFRKK